ncbi:threonylcarbamoyl-AMP synthase [bacterium]|nr:MAG: threonylcarbamoyl-AMP synthase [bacterium]
MIVEPTPENITAAGKSLHDGGLVGIPTETVYGIAASLWRPDAIRRTFEVKGRPADNPLIVHVAHLEQLDRVVAAWPEDARRLAERFWPGPLTMVLPKRSEVPLEATAGLDTVAVRVPAHPVALRLIDAAGAPLTAPSANPFMGLSPSRAEHVKVFGLEMVLDGGPCAVGIESTVVDLSGDAPRLLRPGGVPRSQIEAALGRSLGGAEEGVRRAPGSYERHYAPATPLKIKAMLSADEAGLTFEEPQNENQVRLSHDPAPYAISMYAALHRIDALGVAEIVVQEPPQSAEWEAVWDRLRRAVTR